MSRSRARWLMLAATALVPAALVLALPERGNASLAVEAGFADLVAAADAGRGLAAVTVDYPEDGSIVPPDMVAPTLLWHDPSTADAWLLEVGFPEGAPPLHLALAGDPPPRGEIDPRCLGATNEIYEPTPHQASARAFRPAPEVWRAIQRGSVERPAVLRLIGYRRDEPDRPLSEGRTTLATSRDPVGAPIFYRDVPLMPSETEEGVIKPLAQGAVPLIDWRLRDVGRDESRIVLRDMPTCANCHSFSADGRTLGMDVDGPQGDKGAYAIVPVEPQTVIRDTQVMTWNAFPGKHKGLNTLGFLARMSPDGRYAVATVNEALFVRNFWDYKFGQVFFPTRGILAVYDTRTGEVRALPGADDPAYVHTNAVWSPDGGTLVFSRAPAIDAYDFSKPQAEYSGDPNETQIRYDLYRIPFDAGRGGPAEPIRGASANGMSNSFPKVSPDGKWIVWVQASNGQLMRKDSKLWIVPFAGGEPRLMRANTALMNSWHSFSPNGRWMVFSSKVNTPYTQMFLSHIDDDGNSSPPILIENATAANRAVNLPEFVNVPYDEFVSISVPAVDHYLYFARGNELQREGKFDAAIAEYERALEGRRKDWRISDWRIHDSLSKTLLVTGDREGALEHVRASLRLNPYNADMQANLGYLLFEEGEIGQAMEHLDIAIRLSPRDPRLTYNRGTMRFAAGDIGGALADYSDVLRRHPDYAEVRTARGIALSQSGDLAGARADFDEAIRHKAADPTPWYFRALLRERDGDLEGARLDAEQAAANAPADWEHRGELAELQARLRRGGAAGG